MSKHGSSIICTKCGGKHPVNRMNLRKRGKPGGFVCSRCEGKADKKQRPTDYGD